MDILLTALGQRPRLEAWEGRPFARGTDRGPTKRDRVDAYARAVARETPGPPVEGGPFLRVARAVLAYRVFPPWLIEGVLRRDPLELGDTVGIRFHAVPGLDLFFAARVVERFDSVVGDVHRTGFKYRTLDGHPELGEETFSVEKELSTGLVRATMRAWSRPGTLLAQLGYPYVRISQMQGGQAALSYLARIARNGR